MILHNLKNNYPILYLYAYLKPKGYFSDYKNERKLERGIHFNQSENKSIVLFTTHKAASTFLATVLRKIADYQNLVSIDFDSYFSTINSRKYKKFKEEKWMQKAFHANGYFYGATRKFRKIRHLEKYKVLMVLRDPRDVLTSNYYSAKFSHPILNFKGQRQREKLHQTTIDKFVRDKASFFKPIYQEYIQVLDQYPHIFFSRYEDIIGDFSKWLEQLMDYLEIEDETLLQKLQTDLKSSGNKKEDQYSHRRRVTPGDHKEKLQPETIAYLDKYFQEQLSFLNYTHQKA